MSNILIRLFEIATEKLPFYTTDVLEAAEAALEVCLGEADLPLLHTYEDVRYERDLREEKQLFFSPWPWVSSWGGSHRPQTLSTCRDGPLHQHLHGVHIEVGQPVVHPVHA